MTSTGTVKFWHRDEGWGVIDCADTPGGCWANFAAIWSDIKPTAGPGESVSSGFLELFPGEHVTFAWKELTLSNRFGYEFIASWVHPQRDPPTFRIEPVEWSHSPASKSSPQENI
jgi:cold shock protein